MASKRLNEFSRPIHDWFELTYAQYLTVPRSIMQAMPLEWQTKMVEMLEELDDTFAWRPQEGRYWVELRDGEGKFRVDPLKEYQHADHEYIETIRRNDGETAANLDERQTQT